MDRADARPLLLLVEDHADTRQMYAEYLGLTFDIDQAADGNEALARMHARVPDLVITDLSLPALNGFELVAAMRAEPGLHAVPVICLSGYGGHAHEERARLAGCDRILQKPCMPDTLAELASVLLRETRGRIQP